MGIIAEVIIGTLAALGAVALAWVVWSLAIFPVRGEEGERMVMLVRKKSSAGLWRLGEGISFLRRMGLADTVAVVTAESLSGDELEKMQHICGLFTNVILCRTREDVEGILNEWHEGTSDN